MMMDKDLFNALLRRDFYMFVQRVFREIKSGETFEESWAVEAICYALSEVAAGRRRRQIIAVPPRSLIGEHDVLTGSSIRESLDWIPNLAVRTMPSLEDEQIAWHAATLVKPVS